MEAVNRAAKSVLGLFLPPEKVARVGERWMDLTAVAGYMTFCRPSIRRLEEYRDRHRGERCFIIGNGPSLRKMDLSVLKGEVTFGLNRIYLLFKDLGFETTYYVAVNRYVIEQCAPDIRKILCPKFIRWDYRKYLAGDSAAVFIRNRYTPSFSVDIARNGAWEGGTVTYVAMQLAYYMGFSEVVLIGVDHAFKTHEKPHTLVVSESADTDHFHPDYFGVGFKWQTPDLETSEKAYVMAREAYRKAGRTIVDATAGGRLTVFPKARFEDLVRKEPGQGSF